MKYKVGDKVKLKPYIPEYQYHGVVPDMIPYFNGVIKIEGIYDKIFKSDGYMWNTEYIDYKIYDVKLPNELFKM